MSEANRYGRIVTNRAVEKALVATLELWINDYLGEIERIEGYAPNAIERPLGIVTSSEFAKWPEDQVPCIVVVNTGLDGAPERKAHGRHDAAWLVGVTPVVSDVDEVGTRDLTGAYAAAVRSIVMQHRMLKSSLHPTGFASGLRWRGESYGDIPFTETRSLGAGAVLFSVRVDDVVTEQAGPREPSGEAATDPGPWPAVTKIDVPVHKVPVGSLP